MKKTYKFLVNGKTQITQVGREDMIAMIDGALTEHPMELDMFGRYIVTNEFLFYALMEQIQEVINPGV